MLPSLISAIGAPARTTIPFQYAWRFHYGDDPSSPPDSGPGGSQSEFDEDLDGFALCDGIAASAKRASVTQPRQAAVSCAPRLPVFSGPAPQARHNRS